MDVVPSRQQFLEKVKRGNLVPVWKEFLADQETPVSAYERVRAYFRKRDKAAYTYLLESVEGGENIGRYSFIGGAPRTIIRAQGRRIEIAPFGGEPEIIEDIDPLEALKKHMRQFVPVDDPALPRFIGGAVGFLGYETIAQFEPKVAVIKESEVSGYPDMLFMVTDALMVFDHVKHTLKMVVNTHIKENPNRAYDGALSQIAELCEALQTPVNPILFDTHDQMEPLEPSSNTTRKEFLEMVHKAKEYIHAGDIIQVVCSQRFEVENKADSLDIYRALRSINPSPYMFCLDMDRNALVGASPEIHLRCEKGKIDVRPIAGTRSRGKIVEEDRALQMELLADPKERAEHVMLVDLARNDIGRVCDFQTVKISDLMTIERYSHVMHIVSNVTGTLSREHDEYDAMRATFPAGTVSGAPKIRAMQIIAELEKSRRGPYAGVVGYFNYNGNIDSCIAIRTVMLSGSKAYVQAGAGIVADSMPINEYEETRSKARGMMAALALAGCFHAARERKRT